MKAINDLPKVKDSRSYREWNRRFKNALEQSHEDIRDMFEVLEAIAESEVHTVKNDRSCASMFESVYHIYLTK